MTPEEIVEKLKAAFGLGDEAENEVKVTQEMDARAKALGIGTKGLDIEAGTKALAAVDELKTELASANTLITEQKAAIETLTASVKALETGQKAIETAQAAHQARAVKAIEEVKAVLVTFNAKTDLQAPANQAQLAALENRTKEQIEAAQAGGVKSRGLVFFEQKPDGSFAPKAA